MNNERVQHLCLNDNIEEQKNQQIAENILSDKNSKGEDRPWKEYKKLSLELSRMYNSLYIDTKKNYEFLKTNRLLKCDGPELFALKELSTTYYKYSDRTRNCGNFLEFKEFQDRKKKLNRAGFCRVRLCPMCTWRRSLKAFTQVSKIKKYIDKTEPGKYSYLFLSLTVRNCWDLELKKNMDNIFAATNKLRRWKPWKRAIKGYVQAFEITRNKEKQSKWYGSYHPHVHLILAVNKSTYFKKSKNLYISQEEFQEQWKKLMKLDYTPEVRIEKIKEFNANSIAEIAKYSVKFGDYIDVDKWEFSKDSVKLLTSVLHKRRFLGFGGIFRDARKQLKLEDIESGDLVGADMNETENEEDFKLVRYIWNGGYGEYISNEVF